jgi:hypothetical protein
MNQQNLAAYRLIDEIINVSEASCAETLKNS